MQTSLLSWLKKLPQLPQTLATTTLAVQMEESICNEGDLGSVPGLGRSPGGWNSYPLQYSGLENSVDFIVHAVTKSRTWLKKTFTFLFKKLKNLSFFWLIYLITCPISPFFSCFLEKVWHPDLTSQIDKFCWSGWWYYCKENRYMFLHESGLWFCSNFLSPKDKKQNPKKMLLLLLLLLSCFSRARLCMTP